LRDFERILRGCWEDFDRFWEVLRSIFNLKDFTVWESLIYFDRFWEILRDFEIFWEILRYIDIYWDILIIPWEILRAIVDLKISQIISNSSQTHLKSSQRISKSLKIYIQNPTHSHPLKCKTLWIQNPTHSQNIVPLGGMGPAHGSWGQWSPWVGLWGWPVGGRVGDAISVWGSCQFDQFSGSTLLLTYLLPGNLT